MGSCRHRRDWRLQGNCAGQADQAVLLPGLTPASGDRRAIRRGAICAIASAKATSGGCWTTWCWSIKRPTETPYRWYLMQDGKRWRYVAWLRVFNCRDDPAARSQIAVTARMGRLPCASCRRLAGRAVFVLFLTLLVLALWCGWAMP